MRFSSAARAQRTRANVAGLLSARREPATRRSCP
jgi:hypothetical protein